MSKPILRVRIQTPDGQTSNIDALFDFGSHYTILREECLPPGAPRIDYAREETLRTASAGSLRIKGCTELVVEIAGRSIRILASISPDLVRPLIIGAGAMQMWDISIINGSGKTSVTVGKDMHDPDVIEVA